MRRITRSMVGARRHGNLCGRDRGGGAGRERRQVLICHGTVSEPNPWVLISVDESALAGHFDGTAPGDGPNNHPDFFPAAGVTDCSGGPGGGPE